MHTEGWFAPATVSEARDIYESLGPPAQTVVREVARAMDFGREEYEQRVTGDVVETARDAVFASLLEVTVGTDEEFEAWCEKRSEYDIHVAGSENVEYVVWHGAPFAEEVAAATFQNEESAAVETLRRQSFGRIYREHLPAGQP